jgi:3-deoxy-D-manno-octulosonic-acid transferase
MKIIGRVTLWGYQALMGALIPVFLARLAWRSRRQPAYLQHWSERLALYPYGQLKKTDSIWIHAVSVGETRACVPLIKALKERWPDKPILLTHTTPTGREVSESLFGVQVTRCYLPYDIPGAMHRFLDRFKPSIGLMIETEIWPGIVLAAHQHQMPLCLLSGRLSERSAKAYAKVGLLARDAFSGLSLVCAQTKADAQRFVELGATKVVETGNLKFDAPVALDEISQGQILRSWIGKQRPIFLAASTREGEEASILAAWKKAKIHESHALLVIVPRHPQRFDQVAQLIEEVGLRIARKTEMPQIGNARQIQSLDETVKVVLGDTMGEMAQWYRAADLAYIGGSLLPLGGQNLLEACARGCPVIVGPYTFNFTQATEEALKLGAAVRVDSSCMLVQKAQSLMNDLSKRTQMGEAGQAFVALHQGATQRTLNQIQDFLKN